MAALKDARAVFERLLERHRCRIANTAGDGLIADFPSVVEAVQCAAEVQTELAARNAGREFPWAAMHFRIGVHLGDVMIDRGDLFGEGVNLAARLQGHGRARRASSSRRRSTTRSGRSCRSATSSWASVDPGTWTSRCRSTGCCSIGRHPSPRAGPAAGGVDTPAACCGCLPKPARLGLWTRVLRQAQRFAIVWAGARGDQPGGRRRRVLGGVARHRAPGRAGLAGGTPAGAGLGRRPTGAAGFVIVAGAGADQPRQLVRASPGSCGQPAGSWWLYLLRRTFRG